MISRNGSSSHGQQAVARLFGRNGENYNSKKNKIKIKYESLTHITLGKKGRPDVNGDSFERATDRERETTTMEPFFLLFLINSRLLADYRTMYYVRACILLYAYVYTLGIDR